MNARKMALAHLAAMLLAAGGAEDVYDVDSHPRTSRPSGWSLSS